MALLTILVCASIAYDIYDRHHAMADWPGPALISWGPALPPGHVQGQPLPVDQIQALEVIADGRALMPFSEDYRIGALAGHFYAVGDPMDEHTLQKSNAFDIQADNVSIRIPVNESFRNEIRAGAINVTNYYLLLIPKKVNMNDFQTLRQAQALGVKVLNRAGGAP